MGNHQSAYSPWYALITSKFTIRWTIVFPNDPSEVRLTTVFQNHINQRAPSVSPVRVNLSHCPILETPTGHGHVGSKAEPTLVDKSAGGVMYYLHPNSNITCRGLLEPPLSPDGGETGDGELFGNRPYGRRLCWSKSGQLILLRGRLGLLIATAHLRLTVTRDLTLLSQTADCHNHRQRFIQRPKKQYFPP